jgi:serine protease AprX
VRDMAYPGGNVYVEHWHGRSVLSCMAAILDGQLIGTAPQADYVLLRTEDAETEYIVEEDNWVAGAELCDSLGCDILNTSLGYSRFDDPSMDHTYLDMDGNTTRISIAAGIASQKGMIPVQSAGNSGESDWYFITAPADAHDILAVGAVGDVGNPAPWSSHGPSADGRVKPDVAAMGWGTIAVSGDGVSVQPVNGTSFSSPLVAGLVACLWQLHPQRTAQEIMDAVRRSASQYTQPDDDIGYGIPDFMLAHEILTLSIGVEERDSPTIQVFPMPFQNSIEILYPADGPADIQLFDLAGRTVYMAHSVHVQGGRLLLNDAQLARLSAGSYVLAMTAGGNRITTKVIKTDR